MTSYITAKILHTRIVLLLVILIINYSIVSRKNNRCMFFFFKLFAEIINIIITGLCTVRWDNNYSHLNTEKLLAGMLVIAQFFFFIPPHDAFTEVMSQCWRRHGFRVEILVPLIESKY